MVGREESIRPQPRKQSLRIWLAPASGNQDRERRQVVIGEAQAVADPGADAGPARLLAARLHQRDCRIVVDGLGVHRVHDAQFIGDFRRVWQQEATHPSAAVAVLVESKILPGATGNLSWLAVMPVSRCPWRIESGSSVPNRLASSGL